MEPIGHYHPAIVHAPIGLIIVSALFELIGRATDIVWWRKAAFAMLVTGALAGTLAAFSGFSAEEAAAHDQGVPETPIERHEQAAIWTLAVGVAAIVTRASAPRMGSARPLVSAIALVLHLAAAVLVGVTGYRGGELVFENAAGVRLHGALLRSGPPRAPRLHETAEKPAASPAATQ